MVTQSERGSQAEYGLQKKSQEFSSISKSLILGGH